LAGDVKEKIEMDVSFLSRPPGKNLGELDGRERPSREKTVLKPTLVD
jgi:hypothetical protein